MAEERNNEKEWVYARKWTNSPPPFPHFHFLPPPPHFLPPPAHFLIPPPPPFPISDPATMNDLRELCEALERSWHNACITQQTSRIQLATPHQEHLWSAVQVMRRCRPDHRTMRSVLRVLQAVLLRERTGLAHAAGHARPRPLLARICPPLHNAFT